jgi:glycosyltransferase involved in cell wall biosynthesis
MGGRAAALRNGSGTRLRVGVHVGQLLQAVPGGIGRVTELLCTELPQHAELVAFASGSRSDCGRLASRLGPEVEFRGLQMLSPRYRYELWHRTRRPRIGFGLDVCHAPSLAVPACAAPLVVTINDVAFLRYPETFTRHGVRFHERGLTIARDEAAAVITPSAFTRDELVREGFDRNRVHHVPLGLPRPGAPDAALTRARVDALGVAGPYVLVTGTIEPRKAHHVIVSAVRELRARGTDVSLVIAGPIGWMPAAAVAALDQPGVQLVGRVHDTTLDALYRHAAVVASASVYEGFGLPVLEAIARGRPVVASDIPAHAEVLGDAGRLVTPGDVDAMAGAIAELLEDPVARDQLSSAALDRSEHFRQRATIDGHLAVYRSVARAS